MATGELLAFARPWRRTKTPGISVRALGQGMAELIVRPLDGPPIRHEPMPVAEALRRYYELEASHAREQAPPTDPHREP